MTHIDDAVLASMLDREAVSPADEDHLRSCDACRARLDALTSWSDTVGQAISSMPAPAAPSWDAEFLAALSGAAEADASRAQPIARRRALPRWGWGLIAAGLAGLAFVASPAAAWLASGIADLVRGLQRAAEEAPVGVAPPAASAETGATTVSAAIEGALLVIRLAEDEAPDRIVARATDGALATARLVPGDAEGGITVRPDGFAVAAAPGSTLEVEVPSALSAVEVWVGGVRAARRAVRALGAEGWVFEPER